MLENEDEMTTIHVKLPKRIAKQLDDMSFVEVNGEKVKTSNRSEIARKLIMEGFKYESQKRLVESVEQDLKDLSDNDITEYNPEEDENL